LHQAKHSKGKQNARELKKMWSC